MCFPGNTVEQLLNGDGVYPRLWADLRSAKRTITVQMYYSLPGQCRRHAGGDSRRACAGEGARAAF